MSEDTALAGVLPLSDLTVVEVAESVAGAFCGRMLAAFGARVIKIERPPHGSWTRYAEPQLNGYQSPESGALFLYDNMGKESVVLDWKNADGMASLLNLVSDADVSHRRLATEDAQVPWNRHRYTAISEPSAGQSCR